MANADQIKRRLLREVAQENFETIQGLGARRFQGSYRGQRWLRRSFLIMVPIAVLVLSYFFLTATGHRQGVINLPPAVPKAMGTERPSLAANGEVAQEALFAEPQPFDRAVWPLGVKKIVLDPGHGGDELGAVASLGIAEKEVTLDIALRLRRLLEEASFEVLMTRKKDEAVTLAERAAFANTGGGDIFVSIHVNWTKARKIRFVETYYLGSTDDPVSIQLAGIENRESGYSLADFRRLLEGIYIDARRDESRKLAEAIQRELFGSLVQIAPLLENRGVKRAPFIVLVATDMPAVLAEVSCLSNEEEALLLAKPNYRQNIAQALFRGIRSYADTLNRFNKKGG